MKTHLSKILLALIPAASGVAFATPQEATVTMPAAEVTDDGTSIFGEPLYVGGKRITDMEIKRFLCYGKGRNALEARKLGTLMQQEWELREYEAQNALLDERYGGRELEDLGEAEQAELNELVAQQLARYQFNVEEFDDRLAREEKDFYERYPTLNLDTEIARAYQSTQWYKDQVRQTLQFDDLFFKGHPDQWPAITIEATHAGSPNFDLIEDYAKNHVLRLEMWHEKRAASESNLLATEFPGQAADALSPEDAARLKKMVDDEHGRFEPREDEMMMGLLRDFVMGALNDLVEVKTSIDGLPANVLMSIEGGGFEAELLTEDVYQEMKHAFSAADISEAKKYLALLEAARQSLSAQDALMSNEAFRAEFAEQTNQLQDTMFQMDFLALQGHLFPSVESYYNHLLLMSSYRGTIVDQLKPMENGDLSEPLAQHMTVANGIMGLAKCQAEVLLVSAFDYPQNKWKENGWEKAQARALELRSQVDDYLDKLAVQAEERMRAVSAGEDYEPAETLKPFDQWWSELLDLNSDFWDPPLPVTGKMPPAIGMKNRGRFQGSTMTRNDMKRAIGESSYSHFMEDFEIVDQIFFGMEPGTVAGPFPGPMGYYICYLKNKQRPTNPLNIRDERHLSMIQEDFTRMSFTDFCHAALEAADVKGL